ncbi:MAG: hypothetical protein JSU90_03355 [Nitrospiraceae bacterium]|nr:MAG: hypothetical protein JSU90_03355 [Nitrospiraceae bacterium]
MKLPVKINEREKRVLIIGGLIVVLICAFYVLTWYSDTKKGIQEYSDARRFILQKQINRISEKEYIEKKHSSVKLELANQERLLLQGNTPPVAAAALQKLLKDTASSLNIDVKLERTLNLVEARHYLGIPVEIGFTSTTGEVKDLLLRLRKSPFLITVAEMKVRVTNIRNPEDIYTTLVVTGFIKKREDKGQEARAENNAT